MGVGFLRGFALISRGGETCPFALGRGSLRRSDPIDRGAEARPCAMSASLSGGAALAAQWAGPSRRLAPSPQGLTCQRALGADPFCSDSSSLQCGISPRYGLARVTGLRL